MVKTEHFRIVEKEIYSLRQPTLIFEHAYLMEIRE